MTVYTFPECADRHNDRCVRFDIPARPAWCQLCQTKPNYRAAWERGEGPGQSPRPAPKPVRAFEVYHRPDGTKVRKTVPTGKARIRRGSGCGKAGRRASAPPAVSESYGPGTELRRILHVFRFKETKDCGCAQRAAQMDAWGPDGCEQNIDTIVGWLREQAHKRKLPFSGFVAKRLVKLAIRRAQTMRHAGSAERRF